MRNTDNDKWVKNTALVESDVGENLLLYNPSKELFYVLNITARLFWLLFTDTKTEKKALEAVQEYFEKDLDISIARNDNKDIIKEFKNNELVIQKVRGIGVPPLPDIKVEMIWSS